MNVDTNRIFGNHTDNDPNLDASGLTLTALVTKLQTVGGYVKDLKALGTQKLDINPASSGTTSQFKTNSLDYISAILDKQYQINAHKRDIVVSKQNGSRTMRLWKTILTYVLACVFILMGIAACWA
jgi:hypothetical protein